MGGSSSGMEVLSLELKYETILSDLINIDRFLDEKKINSILKYRAKS